MVIVKKPFLFILFLLLLAFSSCAARIDGELREGGAAELKLTSSLQPRMIGLIRSLRGFLGDSGDTSVLDGASISRSLALSPGIHSVALKNTDSSSLEGTISVSKIGDFLQSGGSKSRFITYTEGGEAGASSIVVYMDRDSVPGIISQLSSEAEEYLSALMAPAVLGDTSTKQEYLEIVRAVYGRPLADEIAASRIKAYIDFPRTVTMVHGGVASGKRAEFDISVLDILVLEQPLSYEVKW